MTLQDTIKGQIKDAMIAKDQVKLLVVRGLSAAFTNEAITKNVPALSDDDVLAIIRRSVKQHKDSIEQFTKGGRADLAASEQAELVVLEAYLPQMMSRDDIKVLAMKKKAEAEAAGTAIDKAKLGQFVGTLMKELKGKADGADVKAVAEALFS